MSIDQREAILERVFTLGSGMSGIGIATRNSIDIDDFSLPVFVMLDADEEATLPPPREGRAPPAAAPSIVTMTPEFYLLADGLPEEVGPALNVLRARFLKLVLEDTTLREIVGPNGSVRYQGCSTNLSLGRSQQGEAHIYVSFSYALYPSELPA